MAGNTDPYEQLSAYLDGELAEADREIVEDWLSRDPKSRQILDDLRRVSGMVSDLPREQAPADLADTITSHFERDALLGETTQRPRAKRGRFVRWATRFAAVAVLAIGATLAWYATDYESQLGTASFIKPADRSYETAVPPPAHEAMDAEDSEAVESDEPAPAQPEDAYETEATASRGGRRAARSASPSAPTAANADSASGRGGRRGRGAGNNETLSRTSETPKAEKKAARLPANARDAFALSESLATKPEMPPASGPFESRLRQNELTNADLRRVRFDSLSNRIVLETDLESAEGMVDVINGFMASNRIPVANSDPLPEPIPGDQVFCYVAPCPSTASDSYSDGWSPEGGCFVMNVAPRQAELLLTSLDSYATSNLADVDWRANWIPSESPQPAQEIIQSLQLGTSFARDTTRREKEAPPDSRLKDGITGGTESSHARRDRDEAKRYLSDEDESVKGMGEGSRRSAGRATFGARAQAPIALAVEIRSRTPGGGGRLLQFPPPPKTTARTTSAPASKGPATTTQPTSQRSEGG